MTTPPDHRDQLVRRAVEITEAVRSIPFAWPGPPSAQAARSGSGTCASKHALLDEELTEIGLVTTPLLVCAPLVPTELASNPALSDAANLVEVHELRTVHTPWAGAVSVDVTWDPPLVAAGLPGARWDGYADTPTAIGPVTAAWAVPRPQLRSAKEALRDRLYTPADREARDRALAALSAMLDSWRHQRAPSSRLADPGGTP